MGRRDELIKSVANYSLRKKHQDYSDGTIYEHDHLTIIPDDGMYDEDRAMFSDSNFKFRTNLGVNEKKKHFRGSWEKTDEDNEYWTLNDCSGETVSDEYKIVLKPKYSSLKDFAYFGSAEELIRATVNDVVLNFPGGLAYYGPTAPKLMIPYSGKTKEFYVISNESNIDVWSQDVDESSVDNPMKVLSCSYTNYVDSNGNVIDKPEVTLTSECQEVGHIIATVKIAGQNLYIYLGEGYKKYIVTDASTNEFATIIKPKEEFYNKFFDNLDDFERVLLNRTTKPVYKAVFDTPYETENGFLYRKEGYVWPTIGDDMTPDTTTGIFGGYLERLLRLADYYDNYESDNIWRMMTHESIKNLDWTFMRSVDGQDVDENGEFINLDSSKIRSILRMEGRQFDDIRRYAINVKNTNGITYDEEGNMPDYFLSDSVENKGWIAHYTGPSVSSAITKPLYSAHSTGYTSSDANINFLRRLSINSDYIQSLKGTKKGLKTVLGLFGMHDGEDYEIKEYAGFVKNFLLYDDVCEIYSYNDDFFDEHTNLLHGLPVLPITAPLKEGDDTPIKYIVPWFDKTMRYDDGKMYFQMKGGWKKMDEQDINLSITSFDKIESGGVDEDQLYNDTVPYMKYAETIDEMLDFQINEVEDGTICYVSDISDMIGEATNWNSDGEATAYEKCKYSDKNGVVIDANEIAHFSHYFVLKNQSLFRYLGYVKDDVRDCWGWKNVALSEFDGTDDIKSVGTQILHLESMSQIVDGNNPHVGNGKYDHGMEFLKYYSQLFKHEIDNSKFSTIKEGVRDGDSGDIALWNAIKTSGFTITPTEIEKKCFVFVDRTDNDGENKCVSVGTQKDDEYYDNVTETNTKWSGYTSFINPEKLLGVISNDIKTDEAASYSVINLKVMNIIFKHNEDDFKKYVTNVVMKYLDEMVPSTTIWEYHFDASTPKAVVSSMRNSGESDRIEAAMATTSSEDIIFREEDLTK